jgi:predicted RNA-binding Zn-ribbon protein involved in translation (DUF1610 family)
MEKNDCFVMSLQRWIQYRRTHGNEIPKCLSCGTVIEVNEEVELRNGSRNKKFLCSKCKDKPVVVYQYPRPRKKFVGAKLYEVKQ